MQSAEDAAYRLNADSRDLQQPEITHVQQAAQDGHRIYHYEEETVKGKQQNKSFFDRLFNGCSSCSSKKKTSRSYMLATDKSKGKNKGKTEARVVSPSAGATATDATLVVMNPDWQPVAKRQEVVKTVENQEKVTEPPQINGILKEIPANESGGGTVTFQKNSNQRRSRGSLHYYREKGSASFPRTRSRSTEKLTSSSSAAVNSESCHQASAIVRGSSPTLQHDPGINEQRRQQSPSRESDEIVVTTPVAQHQRVKCKTKSVSVFSVPERHQRKPAPPVEVTEFDYTPPSLDPRITTGDMSSSRYEERYNASSYQQCGPNNSSRHKRSKSQRNSQQAATCYITTDCLYPPSQPIRATTSSRSKTCSRSQSTHYRPRSPVGATIASSPAPTPHRHRQPRTNPNCHQIQYRRAPSPYATTQEDDALRMKLTSTSASSKPRKIKYAPTVGENVVRCNASSPSGSRHHSLRSSHSHSSLRRSNVPSVPVGSKIDVSMRSRDGQLVEQSPCRQTSSVRYTYDTEFPRQEYERPHPRTTRQQHQHYSPQHHHPHPAQPRQSPSGHFVGPTRVQVGDMADDFHSVYHDNAAQRPRPCQPAKATVEVTAPEVDKTPVTERCVVVTKQVNPRVLEALASTRKRLDQLDGDLDAALKRLQDRNNRLDAPPPCHEAPASRRSPSSRQPAPPPTAPRTKQPCNRPSTSRSHQQPVRSDHRPQTYAPGLPLTSTNDYTIYTQPPGQGVAPVHCPPNAPPASLPMGSNIVLITITDDGQEERIEENEQIIYSHAPPVREVMVQDAPKRVQLPVCSRRPSTPSERAESPVRCNEVAVPVETRDDDENDGPESLPDQFDYTDKRSAVVSPHGTIGNIFHQLTHGKLPDYVNQRFNVEHSEEEIHNDEIDLVHADGSNIGGLEDFQNLDTIYEIINMGIENAQARVCFKVTCQRIEPVNPRAGIWKRKSVTASRVLNIDLSQNEELKDVLQEIQSAPGESVRMIMSQDLDSSSNVKTREKQLDTTTTAWAVAEILGKAADQQQPSPISPRSVEGGPMKFLSPSKFAEEVYTNDILGQKGNSLVSVPFSTRRGGSVNKPWTSTPPPAYRPGTVRSSRS